MTQSKYDSLRAELTKSQAATATARQDAAQADSKAQADEQTQLSQARAQDQAQLQQQQEALAKQQSDAQAAQAAAQQQSQQNAAQKASLDQQQAAVDANSFGDGLYQVGRDIQPGKYHSSGAGGNCYWAKLGSSNTDNIIDNNNSTGPQTITIDSPYFESNGCGNWTKVG